MKLLHSLAARVSLTVLAATLKSLNHKNEIIKFFIQPFVCGLLAIESFNVLASHISMGIDQEPSFLQIPSGIDYLGDSLASCFAKFSEY